MSDKVSDERVSQTDLQEYLRRLPATDDFVGFQRTAPIPVAVVRSAFAELLAHRAQQQAAGWRVKPLEWVDVRGGDWHAQSILGLYQIWRSAAGRYKVASATSGQSWGTLDEAKAAAQSDYAARINSAIEPACDAPTTQAETICRGRAMDQWNASFKRPDLTEYDRVRGAIEACIRQAVALRLIPAASSSDASPISASGRDGE